MIRQPTQGQKCLLFAGPARSSEFLKQARVEVEKDTIQKYDNEITEKDRKVHQVCCVENEHVDSGQYIMDRADEEQEEDGGRESEQDIQEEKENKKEEQDERCKYNKWTQKEIITYTFRKK